MMQRCVWRWTRCFATVILVGLPYVGKPVLAAPPLQFQVVARTGLPLSGVLWTGSRFIYTTEGGRVIYSGSLDGKPPNMFVTVPHNNGEMRCALSPGGHGFVAGDIYCHAASNEIYRISSDGQKVTLFARIPVTQRSDGALTFDRDGAFGYRLLAASGGSENGSGGAVFSIDQLGHVQRVGVYSGPGGAENIEIAPSAFGSEAGHVLITIDTNNYHGRLLAMDPAGSVRTLISGLQFGLNPIVAIGPGIGEPTSQTARAPAGLYLTDWASHNVFFAPATQLKAYAGQVIVGTEYRAYLYAVASKGAAYTVMRLPTNLIAPKFNLEGAFYLGA